MPATPSGGLLIFINLVIVVVGLFIRAINTLGVKTSLLTKAFSPIVDKGFDGGIRKACAYSLVLVVGLVITSLTAISLERGINNNSNYTVLSDLYEEGYFEQTLTNMRGTFFTVPFDSTRFDISAEKMSEMEKIQFTQLTQ